MPAALPALGVLFDCDGVLVDSDRSVVTAWSSWAHHFGLSAAVVLDAVHGRRAADTVAALLAAAPDDHRAAVELINALELETVDDVTAIPGARELVASMPAGSWGVVTSGTRVLATARLLAAGIPLPDVLITAEDVIAGKPDPHGYALGAELLGLPARNCLVVEDANSGVLAARRAGIGAVLGVGARALDSDADVVVGDLVEVSWSPRGLHVLGPVLRGLGDGEL